MDTVARTPAHTVERDAGVLVAARNVKIHFTQAGTFGRRRPPVQAVDGVSLEVGRGETVGLVGESGSGKSTLGRALIRLLAPTSGAVEFDGVDITHLSGERLRRYRRRMQIVFQDPYGSLNPRMRVGAILREPLDIHNIGRAASRAERVRDLLDLVGLNPSHVRRFPREFSGGQRQRIGIARALAVNPEFIVCDEPISALDVSIQAQVLNLLVDLRSRMGLSYLFIAHDLNVVRHMSDRVAVMYLGRIVELADPWSIYTQPRHPYTTALLSAVPIPNPARERARRRLVLRGDLPSPSNPPSGCRFHTRCWLYERLGRPEQCRLDDPALTSVEQAHFAACHFSDRVTNTPP